MEDITVIRGFLKKETAKELFEELTEKVKWHDELISTVDGSKVKINRKMAYIFGWGKGSEYDMDYTYANLKLNSQRWNGLPSLVRLNAALANRLNPIYSALILGQFDFDSVLLNLYKDGKDEIKWHSDKESILGPKPIIACINLGATRKFWFRRKENGSLKFFHGVEDGDLLIMGENCQTNYLHAILPEKDVKDTRISLTFRKTIGI